MNEYGLSTLLSVRCGTLGKVLLALTLVMPAMHAAALVTKIEDHSLPRSTVRTYHVTCSGGRFGIVRIDQSSSPASICLSTQTAPSRQSCEVVGAIPAADHLARMATQLCQ